MISLDIEKLAEWYSKLPSDFQKAIESDLPDPDDEVLKTFAKDLAELEVVELKEFFDESTAALTKLGRIGRIRLLSALSKRTYPYQVKSFKEIVEDPEEGEDGATGQSQSQVLFIEDLKAFSEAVAARTFKNQNLDTIALSALNEAALEHEAAPAPPSGPPTS
ncbi:hypothetical protein [Salipiger sp. PrR003]|uniref:hypothetical protein n=1 Tax=Salipiger sp. PrR003 TaxID=2706776 RepID=UPI0013DB5F85|nr:hypothetical protein [Salipiger sp. PrR003]NDV52781.1 hypothetical protein [Salipiger sp. PrR003]